MRKHLRRLAAILSTLALAAGLTACGQPGTSSGSAVSGTRSSGRAGAAAPQYGQDACAASRRAPHSLQYRKL